MTSRKNIRVDNGGLFSDIIPMRKSFMILDISESQDLDVSTSTIVKGNARRQTQVPQQKKSSVFNPNITYPQASFLAKKLKRIISLKLSEVFNKVKSHRRQIINLALLNSITQRFIRGAFFTVRLHAQSHKGKKLQSVISRNKRPHLIFQAVNRVVKTQKFIAIIKIIKFSVHNRNVQKLVGRLAEIVNTEIKFYHKRQIMNKMKLHFNKENSKLEVAKSLNLIVPTILRRIKINAFQKVISAFKVNLLQNSNQAKKQMTSKLNQSSVQRVRSLNQQRQKIRQIKSDLDEFSAIRTRSRYDSRRDLNTHRTRLREQEKKAGTRILSLQSENDKLENQLQERRLINLKRLSRIESKINRQVVENLFLLLHNEQTNKLGQIKLKLGKQKLEQLDQALQNTDEYHIHENQKLRAEVFMYESVNIAKTRWPQELAIAQQNEVLKAFISCIINRQLQNLTSSTALHEQQFQ